MYCKKCGKVLNDGDKFCSNCGTKIEEEFVPAFRQSVDYTPQEREERKPRKPVSREHFQWDLEGYPTDRRKTEEVNFDWGSVMDDKRRNSFPGMSDSRETAKKEDPNIPAFLQESEPEEGSLEEELFEDMGTLKSEESTRVVKRPKSKSDTIDKFYTFNKKNEELQSLLDQEYERLRNGKTPVKAEISKGTSVHEEFDWTLPGDRGVDDFFSNQKQPKISQPEYVGVALSQAPQGYMAPEPESKPAEEINAADSPEKVQTSAEAMLAELEAMAAAAAAGAETGTAGVNIDRETETNQMDSDTSADTETEAEADSQCPPSGGESDEADREENLQPEMAESEKPLAERKKEQSKLTFDDVFSDDDDDGDERPKKKGKALKVIAIILCILVVLELIMIGIQYFAPESEEAKTINRGYEYVQSLFEGKEQEPEEPAQTEDSEIKKLIGEKLSLNKNVAAVEEDQNLTFQDSKDYGFEDFGNAYTFVNEPWYEDANDKSVTYGGEIIGTVIGYYSAWVDKINGKNEDVLTFIDETAPFYEDIEGLEAKNGIQYGINKLSIGEIRTDGSGFYVLTSVTVLDSDTNKEKTEKQVLYLEPVNKAMKIIDIKTI